MQEKLGKELALLSDYKHLPAKYKRIGISEIASLEEKEKYAFVLAYNKDYLALEAAKELTVHGLKYYSFEKGAPLARYFHTDKDAFQTMEDEFLHESKLHFNVSDFENIFQAVSTTKDLRGDYVEIGTFQGASARAALNYMKRAEIRRKCWFFDTYEGFAYDTARESEDAHWADTHTETTLEAVRDYLKTYDDAKVEKCNVITDGLPEEIRRIAVCNIDVDMYEAVKAALDKVRDRIVPGGIIIAEDYGHTPLLIGAQKATREFLEENPGMFTCLYMTSGQMFLIKR